MGAEITLPKHADSYRNLTYITYDITNTVPVFLTTNAHIK